MIHAVPKETKAATLLPVMINAAIDTTNTICNAILPIFIYTDSFLEVMEHIGYRVEMVDNDGIRKVCEDMLDDIKAGNVSGDKSVWIEPFTKYRGKGKNRKDYEL